MPTNKNAMLRYKVLDKCFKDFRHQYTIEDLIDKVNESFLDMNGTTVSLRQIRDDIRYMRDRLSYNAPIESYPTGEGKKRYYRYSDRDFSIFNGALTNEEAGKLMTTIEMFNRYRGLPGYAWLEEVIQNLEFRFGIKPNTQNFVAFDTNEQLKGLEFLQQVIEFTIEHQPIKIKYRSYKGNEQETVMHPYHVRQYNNRWFLFGMENTKYGDRIANRPLDRILNVTKADIDFVPNNNVDFNTFFNDIIGVTMPGHEVIKERVLLRFAPERLPYVISKPIHNSQNVLDPDNGIVEITLRPNKELEAQIFSYGPQVEVLEPQWLRNQIAGKIAEAMERYR